MATTYTKIGALFSATGVAQLLQFAFIVVIARELGPEKLGIFVLSVVVSNVAVSIFDFGSTSYFTRELAFGRITKQDFLAQLAFRILALGSLCVLVFSIGAVIDRPFLCFASLLTFSQYVFQSLQAHPKSTGASGLLSACLVFDRLICLAATSLYITLRPVELDKIVLANSGSQLLSALVLWIFHIRERVGVSWSYAKSSFGLKKYRNLGLFSLANSMTAMDQVFLGTLTNSYQVGIYGAVSKWFTPIGVASSSLSTVTINQAAKSSSTMEDVIARNRRLIAGMIVISLLIALFGWLLIFAVVPLLGLEYLESQLLIVPLSVTAAFAFLNLPAASLLQYFGFENQVARKVTLVTCVYLACLVPTFLMLPAHSGLVLATVQALQQAALFTIFLKLIFTARGRRK